MATERKKAGRISPVLMGDYDDTTTYRRLDWVYYGGTSYICKKNNTVGIVPSNTERWQKIIDKISDMNITFTENTKREIYTSGESLSTIIGKIQKWLMSLKTVAFTGKYTDLSDTPISLKNPKSLKFTGGSVVEYDGSIEKSINIPTVPSSLKNPNTLNIKFNGTSQASYDGSIAKEVNVTPANIGAVNTSALLNTTEQISANTNANNITGALAAKAMMADYNNKINTINSNLANLNYNYTFSGWGHADITDCDDAPYGFCFAGVDTLHIPASNSQRFLILTFTNSNGYYKKQIAIPDIQSCIYCRHYDAAHEKWYEWEIINASQN